MCKLAVLDPERVSNARITSAAMSLYRSQRSGLGVVAVIDNETHFDYHVEKWTAPELNDVGEFIDIFADDAEWFILHGRLATSGSKNALPATHPIEVNCDECQVDYVLHNGVYASHDLGIEINRMEGEEGHSFTTMVDTELIAHRMGKVPETIDEADQLMDEANAGFEQGLIMLNDERIMLYTNRKYTIDERGEMYVSYADYSNDETTKEYQLMIIEPGTEGDD